MAKQKINKPLTTEEEKFCRHYADFGNGRQAFMYAWPNSNFNSSSELASRLLKKVDIDARIQQHREEVAVQFNQTKEGTIRDLIIAAEEAKKAFQFAAYAKIRDMVIKLVGFYEPEKHEHSGSIDLNLKTPGLDSDEDDDDSDE